jgi:hypothetical protein
MQTDTTVQRPSATNPDCLAGRIATMMLHCAHRSAPLSRERVCAQILQFIFFSTLAHDYLCMSRAFVDQKPMTSASGPHILAPCGPPTSSTSCCNHHVGDKGRPCHIHVRAQSLMCTSKAQDPGASRGINKAHGMTISPATDVWPVTNSCLLVLTPRSGAAPTQLLPLILQLF